MDRLFIENNYAVGDEIFTGRKRSKFKILSFSDVGIRIQPIERKTQQTLNYKKLGVIFDNLACIDLNNIEKTVGNVLKSKRMRETACETYLYGFALDLKHKSLIDDDEANKDDLVKKYRSKNKNQLVVELNRLLDTDRPNGSRISREERKIRDNEVINLIKAIRNFRCQICETSIRTKSGMPYVEGAHIIPKAKGGCESPSNILILCPNHHKEFDKGSLKISEHTGNRVVFTLNKKEYTISLSI